MLPLRFLPFNSPNIFISESDIRGKPAQERECLHRVNCLSSFAGLPWLPETVADVESEDVVSGLSFSDHYLISIMSVTLRIFSYFSGLELWILVELGESITVVFLPMGS